MAEREAIKSRSGIETLVVVKVDGVAHEGFVRSNRIGGFLVCSGCSVWW